MLPDSVLVRTTDRAGSGALCVGGGDFRRHRQRCSARSVSGFVRSSNGAGDGALCVREGTADGAGDGALYDRTLSWC